MCARSRAAGGCPLHPHVLRIHRARTVRCMPDTSMLTPRVRGRVQRALLAWGDAHGQDFPWREARNPYWALVAAVEVAVVIIPVEVVVEQVG